MKKTIASSGPRGSALCPPKSRTRTPFTLVELLAVIAIIALLACLILPVLHRAKVKAHETHCINNLKQIGTQLIIYRDENDENMSPWLSSLYPLKTESTEIYRCLDDKNDPNDTDPEAWDPHWYDANQFTGAYDRPANAAGAAKVGLHGMPNNPDVTQISYFYEFSDATCNWSLDAPEANALLPNPKSWAQLKYIQMKHGGDGTHAFGNPYDETLFPMLRCFWHERTQIGTDNGAPVFNMAYAGNFFLSRQYWEAGVWSP